METRPFFNNIKDFLLQRNLGTEETERHIRALEPFFSLENRIRFEVPDHSMLEMLRHAMQFFTGDADYSYVFLPQADPASEFKQPLCPDQGLAPHMRVRFREGLHLSHLPVHEAQALFALTFELGLQLRLTACRSVGVETSPTGDNPYIGAANQLEAVLRERLLYLWINSIGCYLAALRFDDQTLLSAARAILEVSRKNPPLTRMSNNSRVWYCLRD